MQKSLDQMNVRVHRAVAKLRHRRCKKSEQEIAEQLSGRWRDDHLFSLAQALKMYALISERMQEYELEIQSRLTQMEPPALRMAALSPAHSKTALGAYYRQIARRIAADVTVFATARKPAQHI